MALPQAVQVVSIDAGLAVGDDAVVKRLVDGKMALPREREENVDLKTRMLLAAAMKMAHISAWDLRASSARPCRRASRTCSARASKRSFVDWGARGLTMEL